MNCWDTTTLELCAVAVPLGSSDRHSEGQAASEFGVGTVGTELTTGTEMSCLLARQAELLSRWEASLLKRIRIYETIWGRKRTS